MVFQRLKTPELHFALSRHMQATDNPEQESSALLPDSSKASLLEVLSEEPYLRSARSLGKQGSH